MVPIRELVSQLLRVKSCLPRGLTHLPRSTCCWDRLISAHHFGVAEGGPHTPPSLSFVVPVRQSSFISLFPAFGKQLGNVWWSRNELSGWYFNGLYVTLVHVALNWSRFGFLQRAPQIPLDNFYNPQLFPPPRAFAPTLNIWTRFLKILSCQCPHWIFHGLERRRLTFLFWRIIFSSPPPNGYPSPSCSLPCFFFFFFWEGGEVGSIFVLPSEISTASRDNF